MQHGACASENKMNAEMDLVLFMWLGMERCRTTYDNKISNMTFATRDYVLSSVEYNSTSPLSTHD